MPADPNPPTSREVPPPAVGDLAFPFVFDDPANKERRVITGMSLRDYFAAKALAGMLADPNFDDGAIRAAELAFLVADAMLAERAKGGGK